MSLCLALGRDSGASHQQRGPGFWWELAYDGPGGRTSIGHGESLGPGLSGRSRRVVILNLGMAL